MTDDVAVLRERLAKYEGRGARRRRLLRRVAAAAIVAALLVAGDWWLRNQELDALLTAVEASEAAQVAGYADVQKAGSAIETQLGQAREAARLQFRQAASGAEADVIASSAEVGDVSVLPWHRSILRAKSRYLAHADAWEQAFRDLASSEDGSSDQSGRISGTFATAESAFEDAVPLLPQHDVEARIADVFRD